MKYLLIAFLWAAYCALHSFLISVSFTKLVARFLKQYFAFYRLFYVLISLALLIPLINYSSHFDNAFMFAYPAALSIVRHLLITISLLMFFWAFFFDYDFLSFFGIRQALDFKKIRNINPPDKIKKTGLLGIIRHPMYTALIIYLWCQTFRLTDIVVNAVLTIYIIIGTYLEEKKLVLEFGDTYIRYQHEVPMLIPLTKKRK